MTTANGAALDKLDKLFRVVIYIGTQRRQVEITIFRASLFVKFVKSGTRTWAVTLNQAPQERIRVRPSQTPACMRLRTACDSMPDFDGLVNGIQKYQTMTAFFAHVVGTEKHEHCIVEGHGDSYSLRWKDRSPRLIQTNHFVNDDRNLNPDLSEWDTETRYKDLASALKKLPKSPSAAFKIPHREEIHCRDTQQTMLFTPRNGKSRLTVRVGEFI